MFEYSNPSEQSHGGRSAVASLVVHIAFAVLLFLIGAPVMRLASPPRNITVLAPLPTNLKPYKPPPRPPVRPLPVPTPPPVVRAAVAPPVTPRVTLPKIEIPQAPQIETPRPAVVPLPEQPRSIPAPAPVIKTGEFAQAAPSTPKVVPRTSVEPSGFQATGNVPSVLARGKLSAPISGFDVEDRGTQGSRKGIVSQGAFGEAAPAQAATSSRASISTSAFGDTSVASAPATKQISSASPTSSVEILAKPRPLYTSEARSQGIEGEVLIEVVFEASGSVRVLRLVKGLGHGLDENALAAAKNIQFRPARRDGAPVDSTAVVHIVFQLAY